MGRSRAAGLCSLRHCILDRRHCCSQSCSALQFQPGSRGRCCSVRTFLPRRACSCACPRQYLGRSLLGSCGSASRQSRTGRSLLGTICMREGLLRRHSALAGTAGSWSQREQSVCRAGTACNMRCRCSASLGRREANSLPQSGRSLHEDERRRIPALSSRRGGRALGTLFPRR